MASIAYLIDESGPPDLHRLAAAEVGLLSQSNEARLYRINPRQPEPPALQEDIVVVAVAATWPHMPFLALLRAGRGGRPVVHIEQTYSAAREALFPAHVRRFDVLISRAYALADLVVVRSPDQVQWLAASGAVGHEKACSIPAAFVDERLCGVPFAEPCSSEPLRLLACGSFETGSGFDTLITAMRIVSPAVATLQIAGHGSDEARLRASVEDIEHVSIAAPASDPATWLATADAVLIPSLWDPVGLRAMEAYAAGRTIIASKVDCLTGLAEIAGGILVSPGDHEHLAQAICQLRNMNLASMGKTARSAARLHGVLQEQGWSQLIARLLGQPTANPEPVDSAEQAGPTNQPAYTQNKFPLVQV